MVKFFSKLFGSKKNHIDSMNVDELRVTEVKLSKKIEELQREVRDIEKEIQLLLEKARLTKTKNEEISIARRIKTLTQKKEMKVKAQLKLEKELRAVSNLIILKEHEDDLKSAGVWDILGRMSPEELENWLISKELEAKNKDELVSEIIGMTSTTMSIGADYEEEDLDDILETIRAVKRGDLEPEEAESIIDKKKLYE